MMQDDTPRILKIGDALSQLVNVALMPRHQETTANESTSGRSFRCSWTFMEKIINLIFFWDPDHCMKSYFRDVDRAKQTLQVNDSLGFSSLDNWANTGGPNGETQESVRRN